MPTSASHGRLAAVGCEGSPYPSCQPGREAHCTVSASRAGRRSMMRSSGCVCAWCTMEARTSAWSQDGSLSTGMAWTSPAQYALQLCHLVIRCDPFLIPVVSQPSGHKPLTPLFLEDFVHQPVILGIVAGETVQGETAELEREGPLP